MVPKLIVARGRVRGWTTREFTTVHGVALIEFVASFEILYAIMSITITPMFAYECSCHHN
jgi:hypothetical protein